ncbi:MAG: hypothetical protein HRF46_12235 [Acidobacteriota bacterium]|jgi:hypothetical protein
MPGEVAVETGVFGPLQVARALAPVCRPGSRGRIVVRQAAATRVLWWVDGHIRAITSENDNEWFGTWLLTKGLVSGPVLARALKTRAEGEPLGAALVRNGELNPLRLQVELEELSLALAARIVVADGSFEAEAGPALPAGRETLDRSLRALFAAAVRRVPDVEVLERLLGDGARWEAVAATVGIDKGFEPSAFERFVLDQLTPAKTLDGLRALAPAQFPDTVRALAVLVATGLATPQRKPSSVIDTAIHAPPPPSASGPAGARALPPASPRVKELLARLEEVELEALARYSPGAEQPRETSNRRKGESFRRTALRMLAEGEDEKAAYRLLTRAANLAPSAGVLVDLARYEIQHERWHARVVEHLKRALQMDAACEEAWSLLAEYWELRHQQDKQRRTLERWLAVNPASAVAREKLEQLDRSHHLR